MIAAIQREVGERQITRLCHFTPSRNFAQIVSDSHAIRPTKDLAADARAAYTATDLQRLDGHADHICCSIEYPNAWYLEKARVRGEFRLFPDWVVLVFTPKYLWREGTKFCPQNAGGASGEVREGSEAFRKLFADSLIDRQGRTWNRRPEHLPPCPTNLQAEVLIPGAIPLDATFHVTVRDEEQARLETSRLAYLSGVRNVPVVICPTFFDKDALRRAIWGGNKPLELPWSPK